MNVHERREAMRAILAGDQFVQPASVYDALSARAAEALGFEAMMLAGSTASLAVLGAPDLVLLTLSEFAEQAQRVTRAASLPLMVDADHGYGNALNVMRCVQELESAGVSALSIEDTVLPVAFGASGESFLSVEEGVGKMRAAVAARTDPSLVIFARTGAARGEGLESAVRRVTAYASTGVDGIFLVGLTKRAELEALRAISPLPIVLGTATAELMDKPYLASQGVRLGGWSHQPIMAAAQAAYAALRDFRQQATGSAPDAIEPGKVVDALSRKQGYDQDAAAYLR
jgi:carboxyvinyl-carboxyphosphonate phosphorylmutase